MPFHFRLELANGEPADPSTFASSEPNWRVGDTIYLGREGRLRVVALHAGTTAEDERVLVVEPDE